MSFTRQQLANNREAQQNYISPPANWADSSATHWVFVETRGIPDVLFDYTPYQDIVPLDVCADLYSDLPYRDGARIISGLSHKTLVVVAEEHVGTDGRWHFVSVVDTNPEVDGLVGYIAVDQVRRLDTTPESNEMVFNTCIETIATKIDNFCALTAPQWYETTEPYFDADSCEYFVSVTTTHFETGDDRLEARMQEQIPEGVRALLEYYNKPSGGETLNRLLAGFKFAKASSWWLSPESTRSPLKVLVSVHAKYFQAIPEKEVIIPSSAQNIFLQARTLERHINAITDLFKRYSSSSTWNNQDGTWDGPAPEYGVFNLSQEASSLQLFLSNFKRALTLNGLSLNENSNDTYEIAVDDEYNIQYILANSADFGAKYLTIGISTLVNTHPFNSPRTMSYISSLSEMYNLVKKTKEMPKGWKQIVDEYTVPKPAFTKKPKKCDPDTLDSWDCIKESFSNTFGPGAWKDFKKWKDWHKIDLKCDGISPDKRQFLTPIGNNPTIMDAYKSGWFDDYKNPFAPFMTEEERGKMVQTVDSQDWLKAWHRHGGPSSEFVGDPWSSEINKIVREVISPSSNAGTAENLAYASEAMGQQTLNRLYTEALAKIDINEKIRILVDCACNKLEEKAVWLEYNGLGGDTASAAQADAVRATAAFLGCEDICKTIPLLCACLPFEWPLRLTFPDKLPIVDIMAYIITLILNAIISLLIQFVVQLLTLMLDFSLKCETKDPPQLAFARNFDKSYGEIDAPSLNEKLRQNNLPADSVDPEILNQLLKDTATILKPREFCSLLSGNASLQTIDIVEALITESYPEVKAHFSTTQRIRNLYTMLGEMINTDICNNLADLLDVADVEPSNYICESTDLRENLLDGRATEDQIRELLIEAARCDASRLEGIIDLAKKASGGEDFMSSIIPAIFQDPSNPDGLVPREPPSVKFLNDIAKDTIFTPIENQYNSDYNYHVDTIAPFRQVDDGENDNLGGLSDIIPGLGAVSRTSEIVIAPADEGLGEYSDWLDPDNRESIFGGNVDSEENKISLTLPPRPILTGGNFYTDPRVARAGSGVDIWNTGNQVGKLPDPSEIESFEERMITYFLCPQVREGIQWNRILDAYRVEAAKGTGGENVYFGFNGEKLLTPSTLAVVTDENFGHPIRGRASPPAEALNNYFLGKWMLLPIDDRGTVREILEESAPFMDYHMDLLHPDVTRFTLGRIFDIILEGEFLNNISDIAKQLIIDTDFSSETWCGPRPPGLLDVNDLRTRATAHASRSAELDPGRNTAAMTYGLGMTYVKIFLVEMLLDAIFVFDEFTFTNIMKSDLLFRYFINRFWSRSGLTQSSVIEYGGGFVESIPIFADIAWRIEQDIRSRKYEDNEQFRDPLTKEPVNILLAGEKLAELGIPRSQDAFNGLIDGTLFPDRNEEEESIEEVPICLGGDDPDNPFNFECFEVGNTTFSNLFSINSTDSTDGKRNIGFMEYAVKDLLKSMTGEYETVLNPKIRNQIGWLSRLAPSVDVPATGPVAGSRFFLSLGSELEGSALVLNEETIREFNEDLAALYQAWGTMLAHGDDIHNWVLANPEDSASFLAVLDDFDLYEGEQFNHQREEWDCDHPLQRYRDRLNARRSWRYGFVRRFFHGPVRTGGDGQDVVITQYINGEESNGRCCSRAPGPCPDDLNNGVGYVLYYDYDIRTITYPSATRIATRIAQELGDVTDQLLDEGGEDEGICSNDPFTVKCNYEKTGLTEHGGFVLERFIKVTDKTPREWEVILAELPDDLSRLVEEKIRNRDQNLFDIVNLQAWNLWLVSLLEFHEELELFTVPPTGKAYFNVEKYFEKWEVGTRLTFVYPLDDDEGDERLALDLELAQAFTMETEGVTLLRREAEEEGLVIGIPMEPEVEDYIRKKKAYLLREDLSFTNSVLLQDPLDEEEIRELPIEGGTKIVDVKTLPLIEGLNQVQSTDITFPALHNNTRDALRACVESIQTVFLDPIRERYVEDATRFNNFVLPYNSEHRGEEPLGAGEFYYENTYKPPAGSDLEALYPEDRYKSLPWRTGDEVEGEKWIHGPDGNIFPEEMLPGPMPELGDNLNFLARRSYARMLGKIWRLSWQLFGFNVWEAFDFGSENARSGGWEGDAATLNQVGVGPPEWGALVPEKYAHYTEGDAIEFPPLPNGISAPNRILGNVPGTHYRCPVRPPSPDEDKYFEAPSEPDEVSIPRQTICRQAQHWQLRDEGMTYLSDFYIQNPGQLSINLSGDAHQISATGHLLGPNIVEDYLYGPTLIEDRAEYDDRTLARQESGNAPWHGSFVKSFLEPHKQGMVNSIDFRWGHKWVHDWIEHSYKGAFEELLEEDFPAHLSDVDPLSPIREAMVALRGFLEAQLTALESDGLTATSRCWAFPDDPLDFNNIRKGTDNCRNYDNLVFAIEQIDYFIGKIDGELVIPTSSIRFEEVHAQNSRILREQIVENPQYEAVLEYMIPSSRLISLATIYNVEHVSGLPNREIMFKETKDLIKELYNVARGAEQPQWWNRKAKERTHWWQKPAQLPIPLGLLMVPWKILEALFSIIPWLRKLLDVKVPALPPHRKKNRRGPGCP